MKIMIAILKGILIGIANVVPGVSGGTIAVSMGIYESLIYAVNNFLKQPLKCIKLVWKYVVGIALGILISISGITYLLEIEPIATSMLFVGLILGSLPTLIAVVKDGAFKTKQYISFVIMVIVILFLPMISTGQITSLNFSMSNLLLLFILGLVAAATMVIPGVSGSMVLMATGHYTVIMNTISDTFDLAFKFDIGQAITKGAILIPMVIGIIVGIFLMAKLIEYCLTRHKITLYWGIIGLIVASPFPIIYNLNFRETTFGEIIAAVIMLAVGLSTSMLLAKKGDEKGGEKI